MTSMTQYLQTAAAGEYLGVAQNTLPKRAGREDTRMRRNRTNGDHLFLRADLDLILQKTARPVKLSRNKKAK